MANMLVNPMGPSPIATCLVIAATFMIAAPLSQAAEDSLRLATAIRQTVAFGPSDVLPALGGDAIHRLIIADGAAYIANDEVNLRALVADWTAAKAELARVLAKGEDATQAFAQVESARSALASAGSTLIATVEGRLPENLRSLVSRLAANGALDRDLRPLALTERQRADLLAAQRTRDTVLLDARNWYQDHINAGAKAQYESAVQSILTAAQHAELAGYRQVLESRRVEMAAAEAEAFDALPQ